MLWNKFIEKASEKINICIIGNPTIDLIQIDGIETKSFGGTITFILPWITTILPYSRIEIFCSGPKNCLDHLKNLKNVTTHIQKSEKLAEFKLIYHNQSRQLIISQEPEKIKFEFFLQNRPRYKPDLILICPIFNEISNEFLSNLKNMYADSLISIQAQGFVRSKNLENQIKITDWKPSKNLFETSNIFVISLEEITKNMFDFLFQFPQIHRIITMGAKGAVILSENALIKDNILIDAFSIESSKKINPTGAGDVFFVCTTISYFFTRKIEQSTIFGNLMAKFHLENQLKILNSSQNKIFYKKLNEFTELDDIYNSTDYKSISYSELKKQI